MKKLIIAIIASLALGLLGGYFLFNKKSSPQQTVETHEHAQQDGDEVWTCSMHPQIQQSEPGDCPICGMDLIPMTNISNSSNPLAFEMTEEAVRLANIQTTIIGSARSSSEQTDLRLNGKIEADERQTASLSAHIPGRIEKLYVGFTGEYVSKGQRIARVYSPELITAQRELIEAKRIQDISPELLTAARNKLRFWKLPEATINQIQESEVIQEQFDIYADASGIVQEKRVQVGDHVMDGSVLFEVQNLYNLWVIFEVYERDLSLVKRGDKVSFTTPAVPNQAFTTTINFIDPSIDKKTRVAKIRGEISNKTGKLKPEMFVEGLLKQKVKSSTSQEQLVVPKSAVLWTGKRSVVYVKLQDTDISSFEFREVELGQRVGNGYEVNKGLVSGDEVVTNGAFVIDASAQLNNRTSMMNRNVKIKQKSEVIVDYSSQTPEAFKEQLVEATNAYLAIKDALVDSDLPSTQTAATAFLEKSELIDMSLLSGEAHIFWMQLKNSFDVHGKKIAEADDLKEQRKQFEFLSNALINALQAFGIHSDQFYVQHCPMANNDKGADWISSEHQILNPYFGDKMLKCGFVTDTISVSTPSSNNNSN